MRDKSKELKSFTHQVKIRIEGFAINRLLNKANEKNIKLSNITYISETELQCYISYDDISKLKNLSKSLYKIEIKKNIGIAYKIKKLLNNPYKIILMMLTGALVISQSFFVKTIEIDGYRGIPETEIRECLAEAGIEEGSFIPKINWKEAEEHIYDVFPEVVWLKLVYDGRKVFLDISEGDLLDKEAYDKAFNKEENPKYYCNIIADEAGYIESIESYRGVAIVEEGDYVEKGQVLILGVVPIVEKYHPDKNPDTEYYVKAKGKIGAIVPYRLTLKQALYDEKSQVRSKDQIEKKAEQQLRQWSLENLPENAEILNKDLNFCYKENIIEIGVTLEIRQQMGIEQEILIGQKNSDSSGY